MRGKENDMNKGFSFTLLSGIGIGAGLMYYVDPHRGHARRVVMRDKTLRLSRQIGERAGKVERDVNNRLRGKVAQVRTRVTSGQASDDVIVARARAAMGRVVAHPHAITVTAASSEGGTLILSGMAHPDEVNRLLATIRAVRGVHGVENHLREHDTPANLSGVGADLIMP
jgi:hypothetical protein